MLGAPFSPSFAKKNNTKHPKSAHQNAGRFGTVIVDLKSQPSSNLGKTCAMVGDGHPTFNGILDTLVNIPTIGVDDLPPMGKQPPSVDPFFAYARCTTHKHLRQPTDGFKVKGVDALPDWQSWLQFCK